MHEKSERVSLKSLDGGLKNLAVRFDSLEQRFDALERKVSILEQRFDALEKRFDALEASVRRMGVLLEEMNGKLSLLLEGYMGHDTRIVSLENRMTKVEERTDVRP
jgi:chaperonin cofactor prefoldin